MSNRLVTVFINIFNKNTTVPYLISAHIH